MSGKNKIKAICSDIDSLEPVSKMDVLAHLISSLRFNLAKTHRISELKGVGAEIWKKLDIESYLKKERSEWKP